MMSDSIPMMRDSMRLLVLTAPSGAGKTTIARRVLAAFPEVRFSVSATTRPPRDGERDGVDYYFLTPADFRARLAAGAFLEYEEVYPDRFYGTLWAEAERAADRPLLLDIDVKGAQRVKAKYGPDALTLFVAPPSLAVLEARLRARNTETEETLQTRLDRARMELDQADTFDHVIVNDDLERAAAETLAHIRTFLLGSARPA